MIDKSKLVENERKVLSAVERLAGNSGINELSVVSAYPRVDVFSVLRTLVDRGLLDRTAAGAVRVVVRTSATNAVPAPPHAKGDDAGPTTRTLPVPRPRRKYFSRLSRNPRQAGLDMAARIIFQIERYGECGSMRVRELRRSLHADRHQAAWVAALRILAQRKQARFDIRSITLHLAIDNRLPDPHSAKPKRKWPKRKRPRTDWFERNRHKMDEGQHFDFHLDLTMNEQASGE